MESGPSAVLAATGMIHSGPRVKKNAHGELEQPLLSEEELHDVGDAESIGRLPDFLTYGGISEEEACRRITVFGPNSIPMERMSLPKRLLVTFTKPMALFLISVAILCGAIQDWMAFAVVLGLTILNGLVATFEEMKVNASFCLLLLLLLFRSSLFFLLYVFLLSYCCV
jgi:hypothetical protein